MLARQKKSQLDTSLSAGQLFFSFSCVGQSLLWVPVFGHFLPALSILFLFFSEPKCDFPTFFVSWAATTAILFIFAAYWYFWSKGLEENDDDDEEDSGDEDSEDDVDENNNSV